MNSFLRDEHHALPPALCRTLSGLEEGTQGRGDTCSSPAPWRRGQKCPRASGRREQGLKGKWVTTADVKNLTADGRLTTTQILPVILHPQTLERKDKTHKCYGDSQSLGKAPAGGPADGSVQQRMARPCASLTAARNTRRPAHRANEGEGEQLQKVRVNRGGRPTVWPHPVAPPARTGPHREEEQQSPSAGSTRCPSCQGQTPCGQGEHPTPRQRAARHTATPGPSTTGKPGTENSTKPSDVQTPDFRSARLSPGLVGRRRVTAGWELGPARQHQPRGPKPRVDAPHGLSSLAFGTVS